MQESCFSLDPLGLLKLNSIMLGSGKPILCQHNLYRTISVYILLEYIKLAPFFSCTPQYKRKSSLGSETSTCWATYKHKPGRIHDRLQDMLSRTDMAKSSQVAIDTYQNKWQVISETTVLKKRWRGGHHLCMHFFFINNQCTSKFSAPTRSCNMAWSQFCSPVEISFLLVFSIEIVSWASSSLSFIDTSANLDFLDFSVLCTTKLQAEWWCLRQTIPVCKWSWVTHQGLL